MSGIVSIIYYPGQREKKCFYTGHAELVVEETSYHLGYEGQIERSIKEKIESAVSGKLPFQQIYINVTAEQLSSLKNALQASSPPDPKTGVRSNPRILGVGCMNGISTILKQETDLYIPPLVNLFPLASALYLCLQKSLGNRKIGKIVFRGTACSSVNNVARIVGCVVGEVVVMPPISLIYSGVKLTRFALARF